MNLTNEEKTALREAHGNDEEWNGLISQIKRKRGGEYPPDWYKEVICGILNDHGKLITITTVNV